jgi:beta-lactam-binding protein with PASTA domain
MDTLRRAGLEALVIQDSNPGGTTPSGVVWQQNPPGGTDAPAGSTVRIVVQP